MSPLRMKSVIRALLLIAVFLMAGCKVLRKHQVDAYSGATAVKSENPLPAFLRSTSFRGIMIGHQDDLAYGIGWKAPNGTSDVYNVLGDYPAVFGWDLGGLENESACNLDSVPFEEMKRFAVLVDSLGGINTFSWHLDNPVTGEDSWQTGNNTIVRNILPGGSHHDIYKKWLNRISAFFSDLQDANGKPVNVIFRPFHEHTGNWFWWGENWCTNDEYRRLWQFTHDYLIREKHLTNLIFAYSPAGDFKGEDDFLKKYPGDDYVDIMGFDIYQNDQEKNADFSVKLKNQLRVLKQTADSHNKIAALTEIGYEQIPYEKWWTEVFLPAVQGSGISYALFWRNAANRPNHYYLPYPGHLSEADFKIFASMPGVLFLSKMNKK